MLLSSAIIMKNFLGITKDNELTFYEHFEI